MTKPGALLTRGHLPLPMALRERDSARALEHSARGGAGLDQLVQFILKRQIGGLNFHDLM